MDIKSIREALKREPFRPFTLSLADGRSVDVNHPEFVAITPRIIIVAAEDSSWSVVEPLLIVSLDYASENGKRSNGKRRPRKL